MAADCRSGASSFEERDMNVDEYDVNRLRGVRMRFQTLDFGDLDYHLRGLRDTQQCAEAISELERFGISSATWPLFGVLWRSEELLSHLMLTEDLGSKRILEIGCGLALASLVLKRRGADITATDYHPDAGQFLDFNADLNGIDRISFKRVSWHAPDASLGHFDLVVGSDLLYDRHNLEPLVHFLDSYVGQNGEIVLVDPGRGMTGKCTRLLQNLGFNVQTSSEMYASSDGNTANYWIMRFSRSAESVY